MRKSEGDWENCLHLIEKKKLLNPVGVTRWCSWLRHCFTSRKVAGSIPDGVIGIFH